MYDSRDIIYIGNFLIIDVIMVLDVTLFVQLKIGNRGLQ